VYSFKGVCPGRVFLRRVFFQEEYLTALAALMNADSV